MVINFIRSSRFPEILPYPLIPYPRELALTRQSEGRNEPELLNYRQFTLIRGDIGGALYFRKYFRRGQAEVLFVPIRPECYACVNCVCI